MIKVRLKERNSLLMMKILRTNDCITVDWWSASCLAEQWSLYAIKACKLQHFSKPFHIPRFPKSKSV